MSDWQIVARALEAMLDLPASERTAGLATLPEAIRDEVASLLDAHDRASAFLVDSPPAGTPALAPGDVLGPWRIVEPIGHGGMGAVYRAVRDDGQFEMAVAIKVVSPGLLTPEMTERFRAERQTLASLDHSAIARLVDGGVDTAGRPYLVMELVDGVPITHYLRDRPRDEQLSVFRTVAEAVHYAHQRLIVHRDIKPSNVLVTREGAVKLVDFGIARPRSSTDAWSWLQPMTPEYASPEQLRGDPVSTSADVWGLGALLYEVLSGRSPFDLGGASGAEAAAIVERTIPRAPIDDADLAAIVRRAMSVDPAARYSSPADLAADVARYQRREPVEARPRTWRYAAGRYVARHRAGAALAAVAVVAILAAAATALWQARAAARAQRVAEQRLADVRALASTLIFGVHDRVAGLSGSTETRRFIVENGLAYLDRLAEDSGGDLALQRELAAGYQRLGEVLGRPGSFNLGDADGALAAFAKAEWLARRVIDRSTPNVTQADIRRLAAIEGRISEVYLSQRRAEAIDRADSAVVALEAMPETDREPATDLALASAQFLRASATRALGKGPAFDDWHAALVIYERLSAADPSDDELQRNAALVHKNLVSSYDAAGDRAKAIAHIDAALTIDRARVARAPASGEARLDLTFDLTEAGRLLLIDGQVDAAAEHYVQAVEIRQALADEDTDDVRARGRLAFAQVRLARTLLQRGERAGVQTHYRDAIANAERVLAVTPDLPNTQADRAAALAGLAIVTGDCRHAATAHAALQEIGSRAPGWAAVWVREDTARSGCAERTAIAAR